VFLWDTEVAGFSVRVRPSGSKTFVVQYRAGGGRSGQSRRFTIGRFGVLTVDDARKNAKQIVAAATKGDDPALTRRLKRREMTVSELVDLFEAEGSDHLKTINRRSYPPCALFSTASPFTRGTMTPPNNTPSFALPPRLNIAVLACSIS
jgi:hypothetical protein